MTEFVQDIHGTSWRKDAFTYYQHRSLDRIVAESDNHRAEFDLRAWTHPYDATPTFVPASPDHYLVDTWLGDRDFGHDLVPVIAWRVWGVGFAAPVTLDSTRTFDRTPGVLQPDGRVMWHDYLYDSLDIYLDAEKCRLGPAFLSAIDHSKEESAFANPDRRYKSGNHLPESEPAELVPTTQSDAGDVSAACSPG